MGHAHAGLAQMTAGTAQKAQRPGPNGAKTKENSNKNSNSPFAPKKRAAL